MHRSTTAKQRPRSSHFASYQRALDRLDAHLTRTTPEDEEEKYQRAMRMLFGVRPENTTFEEEPPEDSPIIDFSI